MDKQRFTDTLKRGKCPECNIQPASDSHGCPAKDKTCECCVHCEAKCHRLDEVLEEIFGNGLGSGIPEDNN